MAERVRLALPGGVVLTAAEAKAFREIGRYHLGCSFVEVDDGYIEISADGNADFAARLPAALAAARAQAEADAPLLNEFAPKPSPWLAEDPQHAWQADGDLVELHRGSFAYGGALLTIISALDRLFEREALSRGARAEIYPATIATFSLQKANYIKSFPQHVQFVAPFHYRPDTLTNAPTADFDHSDSTRYLAAPNQSLAPTVCHHCFAARSNKQITAPLSVTATGLCHRHEGGNGASLERLTSYRMREVIFFGDGEYVTAGLADWLGWLENLLQRQGVPFRTLGASDPFMGAGAASQRFFQAASGSKKELCLYLPPLDQWIAVASFNMHGSGLVNGFDVSSPVIPDLKSGCVGFGLDRLAFALGCIFGPDPSGWPADLLQRA